MKKKLLSLLILPALAGLTACQTTSFKPIPPEEAEKVTIGILQPVEHPALGAARLGFIKGIEEGGYAAAKISYRNAAGNSADLTLLAKDLADNCTINLGIGTDAALAIKGAQDNAGYKKPLFFTAVTDPVDAKLVSSKENKKGYVCGTTDANPVEEQIALIKEFKPTASKVGIMYTQTEVNSKVQSDQAEVAIRNAGMTSLVRTCSNSSDIKATALALVDAGVDAIYVPTDNNIAANMNAVKEAASHREVLIVCGEENMLKSGGHVTLSIDYYNLGLATGKMAASVLNGEKKVTDYPVVPVASSECSYVYSSLNLESAGLSMPESILSAHDWTNVDAAE